MASTAQVGRGVGGLLGLAFGIREGDRRTKKRLKAKADLDEDKLAELRKNQELAFRRKLILEDKLAPEQSERFLSTQGVAPTTEQNLFRDINREGFSTREGQDEEKIFREEMARSKQLELAERFGIKGKVARVAEATGGVPGGTFGLGGRTPGDIAGVGKIEAETGLVTEKTETEKVSQDLKRADIRLRDAQAAKATADATKAIANKTGGKKSTEIADLNKLVSTINAELGRLTESDGDPIDDEFEERVNTLRTRLAKTNEILAISKGLRKPRDIQQTIEWYEQGLILTPASWERIVKENRLEKEALKLRAN